MTTTRRATACVAKGRRPSRATPRVAAKDVVDAIHVAAGARAGQPLERAVVADAEAGAVEHRHCGGAAQRGPVLLVLHAGARRVASSLPPPPQQADEPRAVAMRGLRRRARAGGRRACGIVCAGTVARADGDRPAEEPVLRVANFLGPRAGDALSLRARAPERGGLPAFGAADCVVVAGRKPAGERAVEAPAAVELPAVPLVVAVGHDSVMLRPLLCKRPLYRQRCQSPPSPARLRGRRTSSFRSVVPDPSSLSVQAASIRFAKPTPRDTLGFD